MTASGRQEGADGNDWRVLLGRIRADLQQRLASETSASDDAAWTELRGRIVDITRAQILTRNGPAAELEDIVQDALLRFQSPLLLEHLLNAPNPMGYVVVLVRNLLRDSQRRVVRSETAWWYPEEPWLHGGSTHASESIEFALGRAWSVLSDADRMLLRLRFLEDYTIEQIARLQGLSYSVVAVRLHRLIQKLRALTGATG